MTVSINPVIIGIGDHTTKKESEKLAALAAVYQLQELGLVRVLFSNAEVHSHSHHFSLRIQQSCYHKKKSLSSSLMGRTCSTSAREVSWTIIADDTNFHSLS